MNPIIIPFLILTGCVFALTVAAERVLIPILRSHKMGQRILDIGPRWHKSKEGTPIMGGIGFILAILLVMACFFISLASRGISAEYIPLSLTLAFAVGNGVIGFIDDYSKLIKKQNEGLTWKQKLFLQVAMATAFVCVMAYTGNLSTDVRIPFINATIHFGWTFYPMSVILLVGVVNGGNITDGVDGLASSVTLVIGVFFALWSFSTQSEQLMLLSVAILGATLGFLVYNFHPAKVFMGDTGSLFFGSLVIGAAFMMQEPLVGLLISGVFIIEMLSSLLQVVFYKLTNGKRLFRMAPLHHHFEKGGWSEYRVVAVFSAVEVVFCVLAWFAL